MAVYSAVTRVLTHSCFDEYGSQDLFEAWVVDELLEIVLIRSLSAASCL